MPYSIYLCLALVTARCDRDDEATEATADLPDVYQPVLDRIRALVDGLRQGPVSPVAVAQFEKELQQATRELARLATQWTYYQLEPAGVAAVPAQVQFEGSAYRRLGTKTPQQVSTLVGPITLQRRGYRAPASAGEPMLFPLCRELGLVQGATPALVERVAHNLAPSGATQRQTLERLRQEHGVNWQVRRQHLRYADYRRLGLPIGSGVTEAACKTVFTQRLKLSGMRWKKEGALTILKLRVLVLSGAWSQVYERMLRVPSGIQVPAPEQPASSDAVQAA